MPSTIAGAFAVGKSHRCASMEQFHGTTIVSVRRKAAGGDQVAIGGDGQVTLGNIVIKGSGAQGAPALPRQGPRRLRRRAPPTPSRCSSASRPSSRSTRATWCAPPVELAKDWRTDRVLRRLEAMLAVADATTSLIITGNGDVLEPEDGIIAIGSGGAYAQAAAKALLDNTELRRRGDRQEVAGRSPASSASTPTCTTRSKRL